VLLGSALLALRRLPLGATVHSLEDWIISLGVWGPFLFGLTYVATALLLAPASAWTLAAGALFGLGGGMVVASLSSTTAAALAFLIARHAARDWIVQRLRHSPRLDAVDRAVREGGWKIVALLRLSPAVPFNLQNYLYGLTGLRFWPYLLTSWLAMLPGTFLYVYLGHVGRAGVEAASGRQTRSAAEWSLMIVGLLATLVVTLYVTHVARNTLRQRTQSAEEAPAQKQAEPAAANGWPWGTALLAGMAMAAAVAAVWLTFWPLS
jgi:uncharacterized membrane protein YdjX (TVP38/TMEM64 family)